MRSLFFCLYACCCFHSICHTSFANAFQQPGLAGKIKADSTAPSPNDRWLLVFNNNIEQIDSLYLLGAVLIKANGEIYKTVQERRESYLSLKKSIGNIKSITTVYKTAITPDLSYEIGSFTTSGNKTMKHLIIWRKVKDVLLREAEIIGEADNKMVDLSGIDTARNRWMTWCNSHNAGRLVSNAYFDNAVYYNNYRVIAGTASITREYGYMNNPAYRLTLTPVIAETVNENLVFEIGQCSGSYKEKYILVWGKRNGLPWKVVFDSNL